MASPLRYGTLLVLAAALIVCSSPVSGAEDIHAPTRKLQQQFPGIGTSPGLINPNRNNCTAGYFFNATSRPVKCQLCPVGTWSGPKAFACTECPAKRTCCPGSTGPAQCMALETLCPPVTTCRIQPTAPEECPLGTRWAPVVKKCIECPIGLTSKGFGFACEACEPPEPKTCCPGAAICVPRLYPCPRACPTTRPLPQLPFGK